MAIEYAAPGAVSSDPITESIMQTHSHINSLASDRVQRSAVSGCVSVASYYFGYWFSH